MIEKGLILKRLILLQEYLGDLEEAKDKTWEEFSADKVERSYVESTLQMATEACLDISNHIISSEGFREPVNNKDSFQVLLEECIINDSLAESLKKLAQFRIIIGHNYVKIQPETVFSVLQKNLVDISSFINIIKQKYLDKSDIL